MENRPTSTTHSSSPQSGGQSQSSLGSANVRSTNPGSHADSTSPGGTNASSHSLPADIAATATNIAGNVMDTAKDTLNQGMEKINKTTGDLYQSTLDYCRNNPGTALGIAIGSGVTIGFLLGRGSKSRFDDTLWGAVATAALRTFVDRWN